MIKMGVQITELLVRKEIELPSLAHRTIAVDAPNHLYQFLSTIRGRDGSLFTDAKGNVTSHLIGLLSRTTNLMRNGIKLVYVFDGRVPELKRAETRKRAAAKEAAARKLEEAEEKGDVEGMKKYAARTSRLTPEMIADAKELLSALGVPFIDAPSESEAQASHMAKKGSCYGVASQDADCLMFGSPLLIRNLSITARKKVAGRVAYKNVNPETISLKDNLGNLGISQEQLIWLSMLVGTDYNMGGIKGIGPKIALKLVKQHKSMDELFGAVKWDEHFNVGCREVYDLIASMPVTDDYGIKFSPVNRDRVVKLLVDGHNFSGERVEKSLEELEASGERKQRGLMEFG